MIALDTNVIVRYLTQDDLVQAKLATRLFEERLSEADPAFISVVVLVELVWVLDRAYAASRTAIAKAIEGLLQTDCVVVACEADVFAALTAYRRGDGSFADLLIGALGMRAGATVTLTFDRQPSRLPTFQLLET